MAEFFDKNEEVICTADGVPLYKKLRQTVRAAKIRAFLLTVPLVLFILISFVFPIGKMLFESAYNPTFSKVLPNFSTALATWDGESEPGEALYKLLVEDLVHAKDKREIGRTVGNAATRINYDLPGSRSLFTSTARKAKRIKESPYKEQMIAINKGWADLQLWQVMKNASQDYTSAFYLSAVDKKRDINNNIVNHEEERRIYVPLFIRTYGMSFLITFLCLILAYPVSYLLSVLPLRYSNILMILVLLPFWTSLLVRTTSWIALLQTQGVLNDALVFLGFIENEARVQLIYNQLGTIIAMTHILLPFMILPLYSVMKTIPLSYMRAARSLGATPFTAFVKVYLPQTMTGVAAGTLLVFILSIGYYITPALVGGQDGQLISNMIAYHVQTSLNWSLAAALGSILLATVLILYWLYNRLIGIDNMKFG